MSLPGEAKDNERELRRKEKEGTSWCRYLLLLLSLTLEPKWEYQMGRCEEGRYILLLCSRIQELVHWLPYLFSIGMAIGLKIMVTHILNLRVYRDEIYYMQILLSRTQAGPGRTVKKEQEEISPNHVQRINLISVNCMKLLRQRHDCSFCLFGRQIH